MSKSQSNPETKTTIVTLANLHETLATVEFNNPIQRNAGQWTNTQKAQVVRLAWMNRRCSNIIRIATDPETGKPWGIDGKQTSTLLLNLTADVAKTTVKPDDMSTSYKLLIKGERFPAILGELDDFKVGGYSLKECDPEFIKEFLKLTIEVRWDYNLSRKGMIDIFASQSAGVRIATDEVLNAHFDNPIVKYAKDNLEGHPAWAVAGYIDNRYDNLGMAIRFMYYEYHLRSLVDKDNIEALSANKGAIQAFINLPYLNNEEAKSIGEPVKNVLDFIHEAAHGRENSMELSKTGVVNLYIASRMVMGRSDLKASERKEQFILWFMQSLSSEETNSEILTLKDVNKQIKSAHVSFGRRKSYVEKVVKDRFLSRRKKEGEAA